MVTMIAHPQNPSGRKQKAMVQIVTSDLIVEDKTPVETKIECL